MKNTELKSMAKCLVGDEKYQFYKTVNFPLKTFFYFTVSLITVDNIPLS